MIYPYLCQTYITLNKGTINDRLIKNFRYKELALVHPSSGKVLHLKFRREFMYQHSRFANGRLFILFSDVSFDLLTILIEEDLKVKTYGFNENFDGLFHLSEECI